MKKCVADVLRVDFVVSAGVGGSLVERHLEDLRQITFKRFTEEFPGRSLQIWRQLQVFALFRRAVRNMASVENEVPFKPKMTETCVSSKKKTPSVMMPCSAGLQHQLQLNQTSSSIRSVLTASLTEAFPDSPCCHSDPFHPDDLVVN